MHRVAASTIGVITVVRIIRGLVAQPQCSVVDGGGIVSVTVGVTVSDIITVVYAVASVTSISSKTYLSPVLDVTFRELVGLWKKEKT